MEPFDGEKAQRVWQRVRSGGELEPVALLEQSHALAGLYLGLSRCVRGRDAQILRDLYGEHQILASVLRGVCRQDGKDPTMPPMAAGSGSNDAILRSCYLREKHLWEGLGSIQSDPFGAVAQILARQGIRRGIRVLELLGRCP